MDSIIYHYLDENNEEVVAISSYEFFSNIKKNQLIRVLGRKHTTSQREEIMNYPAEELMYMLEDQLNKNLLTFNIN